MANTKSAKKAIRSSKRKQERNLTWKNRVKNSVKSLKKVVSSEKQEAGILKESFQVLQKALDKAAGKGIIHKNKANRLKSRYAKKLAAQNKPEGKVRKSTKAQK